MTRRGSVGRALRGLVLAGLLTLCGAPAEISARAFEPPPGSKNFTAPSSAPNYFSNEAAPFGRGSRTATPGADRFNTAPVRAGGSHAAIAPPTPDTAASAERGTRQSTSARGRTARSKHASSRAGRANVRKAQGRPASTHRPARAASRKSAATKPRAAASRSRPAAGNARHASRASR
jgi:hypothetical protein